MKLRDYLKVLTIEEAKKIVKEKEQTRNAGIKRKVLYLYPPKPGRFSNEELEKIRPVAQDSARTLVRAYFELYPDKTLDELGIEDLFSISHSIFAAFGIPFEKRLLLQRAFPNEYGVMTEEKAIKFLRSARKQRKALSGVYFDNAGSEFYTTKEKEIIRTRTQQNARVLIKAYLSLHPQERLEILSNVKLRQISCGMVKAVVGSDLYGRVLLNRLFKGEYGELNQEAVVRFSQASKKDSLGLTLTYLETVEDDDPEASFYIEEEKVYIFQRSLRNAQKLINFYLRQQSGRSLETIGASDIAKISMGLYKLAKNRTQNLRLLLTKLFPNEYALIDKEKYRKFVGAQGQDRRILSLAYFYYPKKGEVDNEEDRRFIIRRSQENVRKAIEYYMEDSKINDINSLGIERLMRDIYFSIHEIFEVAKPLSHLLLERIFPHQFGKFTQESVQNYICQSSRKFRMQWVANYFRLDSESVAFSSVYRLEERLQIIKRNALIALLYFYRNRGLLKDIAAGVFPRGKLRRRIPSSIFRALAIPRDALAKLEEILTREFNDFKLPPEVFFWRNLVDLIDNPIIFFDLSNPDNLKVFEGVEEKVLVEIVRKIFQNPYPYYSPEKNRRVSQIKIQLLKRILYGRPMVPKDIGEEIPEKISSCFVEGIHDQYLAAQNQCWVLLAEARGYPFLAPRVIRKVLLKGWFSYEKMLQAIEKAKISQKRYSDFLRELNTVINQEAEELLLLKKLLLKEGVAEGGTPPSKAETPRLPEEYARLVRGLKEEVKFFNQHFSSSSEAHLSVLKILVRNKVDFVREEALKILEIQLKKLPLKAKADLIDLLPVLLLSSEENDRTMGIKIVKELKSYLAVISSEERFVLEQTLVATRNKLINL